MTEAASTTSFPAVDPLLPQTAFRTLSQANVHFDDKTPDGSSFHGEYHSKTSQPPTAKALFNGDLLPLRALCAKLHSQITAFLDEKVQNVRLQAAQAQTRRSLQIIQEALDRYPYFTDFLPPSPCDGLAFERITLQLLISTFLAPPAR